MNSLEDICYWIEELPLSLAIGESWLFPFIETLHVIAAVFVLGSIMVVDLRLLGWSAISHRLTTMVRESILWTWIAFAVALITGLGMFITRASGYLNNPAFLWKIVLLLFAGINMLYFHRRLWPRIQMQPSAVIALPAQRVVGAISLTVWLGIMLAGRWIGHIF